MWYKCQKAKAWANAIEAYIKKTERPVLIGLGINALFCEAHLIRPWIEGVKKQLMIVIVVQHNRLENRGCTPSDIAILPGWVQEMG